MRTQTPTDLRDFAKVAKKLDWLIQNVESVIYGKHEAVVLAVVGLLSEGHILLEDVPGTGKTTLARALANSIQGELRRIQFTSDLLPSDVIGVSIYSSISEKFVFQPGPIFANIVLADELNRTTPRTQSSLLEAMSEGEVSSDGVTNRLPRPFMVIATQNPLAFEGTYPLPESQLDRFLLRIRLGYPSREHERRVMVEHLTSAALDKLAAVLSLEEVCHAIDLARQVRIVDELLDYSLDLLHATRRSDRLQLGASSRAGLALLRASQSLALIDGRDYCIPDDLKTLAPVVFGHRVVPTPVGSALDITGEDLVREILAKVPAPR